MKIQVTPTVDKVLDNCAEMVASWQRFLAKIGNKNGERVMGQLHSVIADCRNGDQDAITFLRLDEDYAQTSVDEIGKVPHFTRLSSDFLAFTLMSVVGKHMGQQCFEKVGVLMCSYLKWMASEAYKDRTLEAPLDNDFIYGSLVTEVEALARVGSKYVVGVRRLLVKRHEESCRDIEDQLQDPDFVPNTDSERIQSTPGAQTQAWLCLGTKWLVHLPPAPYESIRGPHET